jgi:hypothetical protein
MMVYIPHTQVNDMLNGIGTSAMSTFDRMKEKVEVLEVQAEVSKNLIGAAKESSLEAKFKVVYTHHTFNIMVLHGQMLECLLYNPPPLIAPHSTYVHG